MKALDQYDLTPYHWLPLAFTIIKTLMIILEVFLPYEHSSVPPSNVDSLSVALLLRPNNLHSHTTKNLYKMEVV